MLGIAQKYPERPSWNLSCFAQKNTRLSKFEDNIYGLVNGMELESEAQVFPFFYFIFSQTSSEQVIKLTSL